MVILDFNRTHNLADFYRSYTEAIRKTKLEAVAKQDLAKLQTGWIRYVLPGWGLPLKLEGKLTYQEVAEALKFMEQISLSQAEQALEVQEQVFQQFGERISPQVRRVYRSAVKKSLEWGYSQEFWQVALGNRAKDRAPAMLLPKGSPKPRYSLTQTQRTAQLRQEIDQLCRYWQVDRHRPYGNASVERFLKDIYGILGWLHTVKNVPSEDLTLASIIPPVALYDRAAAQQVSRLAEEYLLWLRSERQAKPTTLRCALESFLRVVEYFHYVDQTNDDRDQLA